MNDPLIIIGYGANTPVGRSAAQTCAAIRAGISGFAEIPYSYQPLDVATGAAIPGLTPSLQDNLFRRLVAITVPALQECLASARIAPPETVLTLGMREPYRWHPDLNGKEHLFLRSVEKELGLTFHPLSSVLPLGNAATFQGILTTRPLLHNDDVKACIVGGADSYLNRFDLNRFKRSYRIKREGVAQGFIPGEGAAFVAFSTPVKAKQKNGFGYISGTGTADEDKNVTVLSDGHPTGKGLQKALEKTVRDSRFSESHIRFRVSDLNGEYYRGIDSVLAESRFYRTYRKHLDLWHPADCVGETGAASGALLIISAVIGMKKGYAPGSVAMCEAASDTGLRAGCLISSQKVSKKTAGQGAERSATFIDTISAPPVQMETEQSQPAIGEVAEEHAEEAAFNWLLRDSAVHAPHYDLKDLAELDERMEAHMDGLRIAGDAGWELCKEQLVWEEPGEVFAASVLALESGLEERLQTVFEAATISPETAHGLISAFGWEPYPQIRDYLQRLLESESPDLRRIGIAACAINRWHPGEHLNNALGHDDAVLKARALKAMGEIGLKDMLSLIQKHFITEDEKCRFYAAWSAALFRDSKALPVLRDIAEKGGKYAARACFTALRLMKIDDAHSWLKTLAHQPEHQRVVVMGAGVLGDPVLIPWLIQQMENPELSRVAGESFSMITGADIADEDLEGEWPEGFEAGPTEDPEDEDTDLDPDEDLPWPEPERIAAWWHQHHNRFRNGLRYLCGKPVSEARLRQVLRDGLQRQRAAAAIELAMIKPGSPLFEVRAPGFHQQKQLHRLG